jgi:hypothetical protein
MDIHNLDTRVSKLEQAVTAFSEELRLAVHYIRAVTPDAGSSLTKSRIVMEKLLIKIYTIEMGQEPRKPLLGDMLLDNQFTRKLERRIVARMNAIRDMSNLGPHGETVEPGDAARVLDDLCDVLEWYLGRYGSDMLAAAEDSRRPPAQAVVTAVPEKPVAGRRFRNSLGNVLVPIPEAFLPSGATPELFASSTCVSNADYLEFVRAGGPEPRGSPTNPARRSWQGKRCPESILDHPVVYVSHADACLFCDWLTEQEQREGRIRRDQQYLLPTAQQWHAWARQEHIPPDAITDRNWRPGEQQPTVPVSWGEPSRLGLYHLFGNVFQWCSDEGNQDGVPHNLTLGGGWATLRQWLEQEIQEGRYGAVWRRRGLPMKDGGFRICLAAREPGASTVGAVS